MTRLFISYRRSDTEDMCGRIFDRLAEVFGEANIFKDVYSIPLGRDFRSVLRQEVGKCDVMLVVIGRIWLTVTDELGRRRLDNPADFVRIEVEEALRRGIPVVPVLVQNSGVPRESDLPPSMADLAYRNGFTVRGDPYFRGDVGMLISRLEGVLVAAASVMHPLVDEARTLIRQQKYAEAAPLLERATREFPNDAVPRAYLAWAYGGERLYEKALSMAEFALATDANLPIAWAVKGMALGSLKRYDEALAAFDRACSLDATQASAWNGKGAALNGLTRHEEALADLDRALALDPGYARAWANKAISLRALGRTKEAEEAERKAKALGG